MDHPEALEGYKPRVGHKRRVPAALCLHKELEESCPSGSCQDLWHVQGTAAGMEKEVFTASVIRQLNLYGFTKVQRDFQRSASLPEFLSEEAAASAHSQVQQLLCTATNTCEDLRGERDLHSKKGLAIEEVGMGVSGLVFISFSVSAQAGLSESF
uniref:HSF-type DNA-binding domain-containing protein n=1 Tax=Zosterops lateralis melanops TaxID=1220523 RepID=A0A8D2NWZ1_ZOSLA